MEMKFDITKITEEIIMQAKETQAEFIIETIQPYCENILQTIIDKEELKQILLNGIQKQQTYKKQIIKDWLSTFNTDSATACFTAVQELKKKI